jgi:RNA polymerase sigma factor (sigma-70 family)
MQQYHSNTGDGSLSVFLAELVQRHLESVLAANPPEVPGGGVDDLQCRLSVECVPPMRPDDDPQPVSERVNAVPVENPGGEGSRSDVGKGSCCGPLFPEDGGSGGEGKPGFPTEECGGEEAQALVVSCMERVRTLAWKYADGSYDRFEELVSIGMLGLCEAAVSLPVAVRHPQGYLCQAARHDMLDELHRLHACSTVSLDAPLSDTSSFTLHDILPSLAAVATVPASKRERALYDALARLFVRQRAAVRRRAGLPGYGVHSLKEIGRALHASPGAAHCLDQRGRRKLARDARLCEVMGVEVVK